MCRFPRLAAALLLVSLTAPGWAATFRGVTVPDAVKVEGKDLRLQGLGLRKKLVFSVYVGALYLAMPTSDGDAALRAEEPKRVALFMLRTVSGKDMRAALEEGIFKNAQERMGSLKPRMDKFLALLGEELQNGQRVDFTYLPGKGTELSVDGQARGLVPGKDFMEAFYAIWLGGVPVTADLKKQMLGLSKP